MPVLSRCCNGTELNAIGKLDSEVSFKTLCCLKGLRQAVAQEVILDTCDKYSGHCKAFLEQALLTSK